MKKVKVWKSSIYPEIFFFMLSWLVPILYGSFWAVRFTQMLAIPIYVGTSFRVLFELTIKMIKKYQL
jgi:ABC-type uncharacterized transport system permease subunit